VRDEVVEANGIIISSGSDGSSRRKMRRQPDWGVILGILGDVSEMTFFSSMNVEPLSVCSISEVTF